MTRACSLCYNGDMEKSKRYVPTPCEYCGDPNGYLRRNGKGICSACTKLARQMIHAWAYQAFDSLERSTTPTESVETPADGALAELLECVWSCEREWRREDRIDSKLRYDR